MKNSKSVSAFTFEPIVAVNGVIGAGVSPLDRGFNYGDGLFETVRLDSCSGRAYLPLWSLHRRRLLDSCSRLLISLDPERLDSAVEQLLQQAVSHNIEQAVVKVVVSRGVGGRGYLAPESILATLCVGLYPAAVNSLANMQEGVHLHLCQQRLSSNSSLAGMKHLSKLEYVLARSEWRDKPLAEGVLLDAAGNVVEGTFSNVFVVLKGKLLTPALLECGVAGVMRRLILDVLAPKLGVVVLESDISLVELEAADEVFTCNSVCGIWPALSLSGAVLKCGWHRGALTIRLQAELDTHLLELARA